MRSWANERGQGWGHLPCVQLGEGERSLEAAGHNEGLDEGKTSFTERRQLGIHRSPCARSGDGKQRRRTCNNFARDDPGVTSRFVAVVVHAACAAPLARGEPVGAARHRPELQHGHRRAHTASALLQVPALREPAASNECYPDAHWHLLALAAEQNVLRQLPRDLCGVARRRRASAHPL